MIADLINHWHESGAGERSNFQSFIRELCGLLGVPRRDPARANDHQTATTQGAYFPP